MPWPRSRATSSASPPAPRCIEDAGRGARCPAVGRGAGGGARPGAGLGRLCAGGRLARALGAPRAARGCGRPSGPSWAMCGHGRGDGLRAVRLKVLCPLRQLAQPPDVERVGGPAQPKMARQPSESRIDSSSTRSITSRDLTPYVSRPCLWKSETAQSSTWLTGSDDSA